MLIQFNFKNFKSFKEEVSLDLSATKISEHSEHVTEIANDKLLKVAAIYGANASGKSNIYEAFNFMTYYVLESFKFGGESDGKYKNDLSSYMKVTPFLLDINNIECESTFEIFFVDKTDPNQKTFQYGFAINQEEVVEEWLFSKAKTAKDYKTVFYRKKGQELEMPGIAKKSIDNIKIALENEVLIVSLGSKLKIPKLKLIRDWFLNNESVDYGNPTEDFFRSKVIPENFSENKKVQKKIVDFFASFDESICGFEVEEIKENENGDNKKYRISALHKMNNSDNYAVIPLKEESSGTLKMFSLYPVLQRVLETGSILFIDELNARLHPLLVRNIILSFLNKEINTKNAQLIFTTHDIWQLSNDLLRRDEIWFVDKDNNGISSLYSLADFVDEKGTKIRKDESFAKNYLIGKYGAIPSLKAFSMLKEE